MAGTRLENEQNSSSGYTPGTERLQEKARTTKEELGIDVIKRDLREMALTWEEAGELANDKAEWGRRVAQCSHLDAG